MIVVLLTVVVLLPATSAAATKPDRMYPVAESHAPVATPPMAVVELEIGPVEILTDALFHSLGGIPWWVIAALSLSGLSILYGAALVINRRQLDSAA